MDLIVSFSVDIESSDSLQYLHLIAESCISSAQKGQIFIDIEVNSKIVS